MPDLVRLRYVGDQPVTVPDLGRSVEPDSIADVAGKVLRDDPDVDYFLVEVGGQERAFPRSKWRNETVVSTKKPKE